MHTTSVRVPYRNNRKSSFVSQYGNDSLFKSFIHEDTIQLTGKSGLQLTITHHLNKDPQGNWILLLKVGSNLEITMDICIYFRFEYIIYYIWLGGEKKPFGYWDYVSHQRDYLDGLAPRLGVITAYHWYTIPISEVLYKFDIFIEESSIDALWNWILI